VVLGRSKVTPANLGQIEAPDFLPLAQVVEEAITPFVGLAVFSLLAPQKDLTDFGLFLFQFVPASVQGLSAEANSRSPSDRFPAPSES
jgi:hypothetical protein